MNGDYKRAIKPIDSGSMANPYKHEKRDEWAKICEKYGEEDKSKFEKKKKKK